MIKPGIFFKCLSDETRLRCMVLLHQEGELCVCEITHALNVSQPKISRHLAHLRQCSILLDRREGQWVYYKVNPSLASWAREVLDSAIPELQKSSRFREDFRRLKSMKALSSDAVCKS